MTRFQNNGAGSHLKQFGADFNFVGGKQAQETFSVFMIAFTKPSKIFCLMSHKIKEGDKTM